MQEKMRNDLEEQLDKINNYQNFVKILDHMSITMFMTDVLGKSRQILKFLRSRIHIWIFTVRIGRKNWIRSAQNIFVLQNNHLLHKWS